ncbi:FxSxx-COOH system tetratricopeptide repeat protein [Streptomyces mayonensis]|uniref:FxSxx-COOH system tetratricopeptide repeat protein n=1 Tax=Streptomyces mayonensis TaxID=2750816 RepID=UPI001C1DE970|nr:FxSxx-COOH system tetratricopeptide repeat protein [Streptomyces sp. A108]MBU6533710.1 tetratricopeptide repeat protein [Streptomyces sp. A108]
MSAAGQPLLIEPVVAWPRQAEAGCDYLVTVDLRGPLPAQDGAPAPWPYPEEEFTFTVALDGSPYFDCSALGEPSVVLHRFGGTYGPARFRVSAGTDAGPASLWLTVSNQWGVPVRKAELHSEIRTAPRVPEGDPVRAALPGPRPRGHPRHRPRPALPAAPSRPAHAGPAREPVTISFVGFNQAWAAWIGDRLESRGVRVVHARRDGTDDAPPLELLRDLVAPDGGALLVLSPWYFGQDADSHEEWNAALRDVVAPDPSRFAAVAVTSAALPSAAAVLAPVSLVDVNAEEAERRLLDRLHLASGPLAEDAAPSRRGPRFPAEMPDVWGGVPRRNTRFTGREPLLGKVHGLLHGPGPEGGVVTLHGMSGVGKTQIAAEYAHRFGSEYDVVWWVTAEDRAGCRRQLAELASQMRLETGQGYGERLRAVRDALRRGEPCARWLLLLDGADEPDQIWDLLPAGSGPGHVLITSRNPEWGEHHSELVEVQPYPRDESVAFVRRRAPRLTEPEADRLARAMGDLPLLLDQTAGWLNDSDLSFEEYLALLDAVSDGDPVKVSADFPMTFRTAWSILLDRLRATVPEAVELLRLCTFFAPGLVPVHLLQDMPHEGLPGSVAGLLTDARQWDRAVGQLLRYSVVRVEPHPADPGRENLYVHRVVHQMVHRAMPAAVRGELVDVVRRALAAADRGTPSVPGQWPRYAEIVPHLKYADVLASTDSAVQKLVLDSLRYLYLSGEYGAGVRLGDHAVRIWRSRLGEQHPLVWELTYHYANLLRASGDYHRTMEIEQAAVEHLREQRGERDPALLRALGGLAADLRGLGRYARSLEISQQVHATYRELLGDQDTRTLNAQNNVAVSLRLLGRYEDALHVDLRTLEARLRLLGDRHPWTLGSETSYAVDLRLLGRGAEAATRQADNLRLARAALGAHSRQTLLAAHNLALCLYAVGDTSGAAHHLGQALEQGERVFGGVDPLVLALMTSQSCVARERGDLGPARALSESVVAQYEATLTATHPYAAGARANHAVLLHRAGETGRARVLADAALAGMAAAVGPDHPWTLGCALNASTLHGYAGDTERSLALGRDTADGAARTLGTGHPLTRSARAAAEGALGSRQHPFWDFEPQRT